MKVQRSEIAHIDLDAYFVAVEQRDDPSLKGKPVIVGGSLSERSVVTSCSYEVRAKGVHAGMALRHAHQLCPEAILKPGRMEEYHKTSLRIIDFFQTYTPNVKKMSIDEAFLDFRNTHYLYKDIPAVLKKLQRSLLDEFGLPCSIGLAPSHYFAKIASDHKKPFGFVHIEPQNEAAFIASLPLEKIWGLGKKGLERLKFFRITTMDTLRATPAQNLQAILGKSHAGYILKILNGEDPNPFTRQTRERSMSAEETFSHDLKTLDAVKAGLLDIAQKLALRLNFYRYSAGVLVLKVRFEDFSTFTTQKKIPPQKLHTQSIYTHTLELFEKRWPKFLPVRLIGIGAKKLQTEADLIQDLFESTFESDYHKLDKAVFAIKSKYGDTFVRPARTLALYPRKKKRSSGGGKLHSE